MRGMWLQGQVAEFIDDQQLRLGVVRQFLVEPAVELRLHQGGDQRGGAYEQHRVANRKRFASERHGQMRFADARRTKQQQRFPVSDETTGGELTDLLGIERGLRLEV